jgi:hypothetical protein
MREVVSQEHGWVPDATGRALAFTGYDAFAAGVSWPDER